MVFSRVTTLLVLFSLINLVTMLILKIMTACIIVKELVLHQVQVQEYGICQRVDFEKMVSRLTVAIADLLNDQDFKIIHYVHFTQKKDSCLIL